MRLLILFSAWAPDSEDGMRWCDFYADWLDNNFAADDKIVVENCGSTPSASDRFGGLKGAISHLVAPEGLHIGSDASGFQVALEAAVDRLDKYDVVLFVHTKGASHPFSENDGLRRNLTENILNRERLFQAATASGASLICQQGHLPQAPGSIDETRQVCRLLGLPERPLTLVATYTLYAVSASRLLDALSGASPCLYRDNLETIGYNRHFFEGAFPSVLSHEVDNLIYLVGAEPHSSLNQSVCADVFPKHNSFLCKKEFDRYRMVGELYMQGPTPYIFGPASALEQIDIRYCPV